MSEIVPKHLVKRELYLHNPEYNWACMMRRGRSEPVAAFTARAARANGASFATQTYEYKVGLHVKTVKYTSDSLFFGECLANIDKAQQAFSAAAGAKAPLDAFRNLLDAARNVRGALAVSPADRVDTWPPLMAREELTRLLNAAVGYAAMCWLTEKKPNSPKSACAARAWLLAAGERDAADRALGIAHAVCARHLYEQDHPDESEQDMYARMQRLHAHLQCGTGPEIEDARSRYSHVVRMSGAPTATNQSEPVIAYTPGDSAIEKFIGGKLSI